MTDSVAQRQTMPEIRRAGVDAIFVSHWHVGDAGRGRSVLDEIAAAWRQASWPEEILTFSCYLSCDGDTVMTYAQCADPHAYRPFVRGLPAASARVEPVEYRLYRSVVLDPAAGEPGAVVAASFDVDGVERQRRIVESVAANLEGAPPDDMAGLIASNFHLSLDGTRVINFAEWTTDEAHVTFLDGATRHGSLRIAKETPGIRPIGFTRYHLHRSLFR